MVKELEKILFVDDEEDILTVVQYSLEDSLPNVSTRYVNSGEKAIQEAFQFQPDLIFLDVMMPKMDGITTYKTIQALPSLTKTPIVFMTGKVQKEEVESYFKLGAIEVIIKPFDPLTLGELIKEIWKKSQEKALS